MCKYAFAVVRELGFEECVYVTVCACVGGCMRNVFSCYLFHLLKFVIFVL